jgi:hypothetical protein
MDGLTFSIRLIEALAWPVTIASLTLALACRPEIRGLVPLLHKLKAGPLEAEFEREIREISEEAGEATAPEIQVEPDRRLVEMTTMYPRTAIQEAWAEIEKVVKRAAVRKNVSLPPLDTLNQVKAFRELLRIDGVSSDDAVLLFELRRLRDRVEKFDPSSDAALEYVELASHLKARLERLL